jgi:hypothetical protein
MKSIWEPVASLATALALIVSIITFAYTYRAQEKFNSKQLSMMAEANKSAIDGLRLQKEASDAQREAAAVEALGKYLETAPTANRAWATAEAIIDLVGNDSSWQATARRTLKHNSDNAKSIECELYSKKFVAFAAATFKASVEDFCNHRATINR